MFEKLGPWMKANPVKTIFIVIVAFGLMYTLVTTPYCGSDDVGDDTSEEVTTSGEG